MASSPDHDEDLWVVTAKVPGRCFLVGNAHTHPGHVHARSEDLGKLVTIRKDDLVDASPTARAWLAGFLVGNEPSFATWLGVSWDEADEHYSPDDPLFEEWQVELRQFRERGWMPHRKSESSEH